MAFVTSLAAAQTKNADEWQEMRQPKDQDSHVANARTVI